mgnify:CR=1 FL=1
MGVSVWDSGLRLVKVYRSSMKCSKKVTFFPSKDLKNIHSEASQLLLLTGKGSWSIVTVKRSGEKKWEADKGHKKDRKRKG